jgi:ComEC/Rec2-related protein
MWGIFVWKKGQGLVRDRLFVRWRIRRVLQVVLRAVVYKSLHTWAAIALLSVAVSTHRWLMSQQPVPWPTQEQAWEGIVLRLVSDQAGEQRSWVEVAPSVRIELTSGRFPRLHEGERIAFRCRMRGYAREAAASPWRAWRARHGLAGSCQAYGPPERRGVARPLMHTLGRARAALADRVNQALPEPHASFAVGTLTGATASMPPAFADAMRRAGLTHLVAVSGSNVAWVLLAAQALWKAVGGPWRLAPAVSAAAVLAFTALAGAPASALRAAAMALLALLAQSQGRVAPGGRALFLALLVFGLAQPAVFVADPGFQLSCAATAGLLWLAPWLKARQPWITERFGLATAWSTSVAASLATLPVSLFWFGGSSLLAPFANVLVAPVVPIVMFGSAAGVLGSFLSCLPIVHPLFAFLSKGSFAVVWCAAEWVRLSAMLFGSS